MAIRIGHAAADENKKAHGGTAGDQTGAEVCIRTWYSSPWDLVLRCRDSAKAEKMAQACEAACANARIGYDQYERNTLFLQAKAVDYDLSRITVACECDCSSLMTVCAQAAGINVPYISGNAPYTGNMKAQFLKTGMFEALNGSKYLSSDAYLKRGDILVRTSGHTAMALENGAQAGGNQSSSNKTTTSTGGAKVNISLRTLRYGSKGNDVKALQLVLNGNGCDCGTPDGDFGSRTQAAVRAFQTAKGLGVDGIAGKDTLTALYGG